MSFYVYILKSLKDESYYIGSTQDLSERIERHNQGRSNYTKSKRPWKLVYSEETPDRSSAVKRENEIKARKSKKFIEALVERHDVSLQNPVLAPDPGSAYPPGQPQPIGP